MVQTATDIWKGKNQTDAEKIRWQQNQENRKKAMPRHPNAPTPRNNTLKQGSLATKPCVAANGVKITWKWETQAPICRTWHRLWQIQAPKCCFGLFGFFRSVAVLRLHIDSIPLFAMASLAVDQGVRCASQDRRRLLVDIFASSPNITWLGCEHISNHAAVFARDRSRQTATMLLHWQVRLQMQNWTSLQSQFCPYQHLGIQSETSDIFIILHLLFRWS